MGFILQENFRVANWYEQKMLSHHLVYCGHEIVNAGYCNYGLRSKPRPMLIWQYTLKGCGRIRYGGEEYEVPPGYCFLAVIPENHCYYIPEEQPTWEFIYMVTGGEETMRLAAELRKRGSVFALPLDSPAVKMVFDTLEEGKRNGLNNLYRNSHIAYKFIMELFQAEFVSREPTTLEEAVLERVRKCCRQHLSEAITVSDLAKNTGYSRCHFSRVFMRAYGKSPHIFIIEQKMNHALTLLKTTKYPLKTISGQCGIEDPSYFCKAFKRFFGVTPDSFRRNITTKDKSGEGSAALS